MGADLYGWREVGGRRKVVNICRENSSLGCFRKVNSVRRAGFFFSTMWSSLYADAFLPCCSSRSLLWPVSFTLLRLSSQSNRFPYTRLPTWPPRRASLSEEPIVL